MKIVHLCNYYQELLGYQEYYLAHAQMTNGHDVHIVTGDRYFPFPSYETTVLAILGPRIVGCGLFSASKITIHRLPVTLEIASRVWLKDVIQRICDINPDLIICHGVSNFNALRLAVSKIVTAPVVFDEHMLKREMRGGLLSAIYYKIFRNLVAKVIERRATAIVGVAEGCIDFLRDEMVLAPKIDYDSIRN
jgi:hypothetical protein